MKFRRIFVFLLALVLTASFTVPGFAEERTVHVSTADELRELIAKCRLDTYSEGLTVLLDCDIDLKNEPIEPFAAFSGCFDGQGHTISGLKLSTDGGHQGFFRYVQEGALIKSLRLQGTVSPENIRTEIGGLCGTNYGVIEDCGFSGTVKGLEKTGGIVGENLGVVRRCTFSGTVSGKRHTGGIAGYNEGVIEKSENAGDVNVTVESSGMDIGKISLSDISSIPVVTADAAETVSDTGGIAGLSVSGGVISSCVNTGTVGYQHYGYNVGGIVGRQSGYVVGCENRGSVLGRKDTGGIVGQMEPFMLVSAADDLIEELGLLSDSLGVALSNMGSSAYELSSVFDSLGQDADNALESALEIGRNSGTDIADDMRDIYDDLMNGSGGKPEPGAGGEDEQKRLEEIAEELRRRQEEEAAAEAERRAAFENAYDILSASMGSMSDNIGRLNASVVGTSSRLAQDLQAVNYHFYRASRILGSLLNGERVMYDDVSDDDSDDMTEGKVSACVNCGSVEGDTGVGGITGDMGIELDFDLEGIINQKLDNITSTTYTARCVVRKCINNGVISGKKNNIGGVAGYAELGSIIGCEGYGAVTSDSGSYVGGIAGRSDAVVRESYSMCELKGESYLGGIAGQGTKIIGCGSRVEVSAGIASVGAIAGWADVRALDTAAGTDGNAERPKLFCVRDNRFAGEELGGVDGVSYSGRAEPMTDGEFMALESVPERFKELTVTFKADGATVKVISGVYGGKIDPSELPPIPQKDGYTASWPEAAGAELRADTVIEAVYRAKQSSIASELRREGSELSVLLLNGSFSDRAVLSLKEYESCTLAADGAYVHEKWEYAVENDDETENYSLRFMAPETIEKRGELVIYVLNGDTWVKADTKQAGSYTVFDGSGSRGVFAAVEFAPDNTGIYASCCLAGLLAAVLTVFILLKRKKKRRADTDRVDVPDTELPFAAETPEPAFEAEEAHTAPEEEIGTENGSP